MKFDRAVNVVLAGCALVVTFFVVRRNFAEPGPAADSPSNTLTLAKEARLKTVSGAGREFARGDGRVTLTVFTDLECPFCARFHHTLDTLFTEFPGQVTARYVHFPLSIHKFAKQASAAAECASDQQRFEPFVRAVFERQDSLGLLPWSSYAKAAQVSNLEKFEDCVGSPPAKLVEYGVRAGDKLGVRGTPTIFINDYRFSSPPKYKDLRSAVQQVLAGKSPSEVKLNE